MSLNKIIVMGRIVNDIEPKKTQSGVEVCSFKVACDRDFKSADGKKECDFIPVVAWRNTASFLAKYFGRGRMIVVDGKLQSRQWTDKNNNRRTEWEIQADNVYFADSKQSNGGGQSNGVANENTHNNVEFTEEDDFSEENLTF